jgi:hypothetical protein
LIWGSGAAELVPAAPSSLAFTADQFMRGNIIAIGPIAEILVFLAAPLCILTAGLIRIGSVCVYAVCAPAQDGRRVISDLLASARP